MSETNIARALIDRNSGTAPAGDVDVRAVIDRAERMPAPAGSSRLEVMAGRVFSADHVKSLNTGILPAGEVSAANLHIDNIGTLLAADIPILIPMIELPVPGMIPPTTLRQICETSLMSSPRIWAEYSTMAAPAQADFLARAMKRDGGFQKAIMAGYAELTDPAVIAARSGGVESAAVRAERTSLQTEITADQARITALDGRLAAMATQMQDFESYFDTSGTYQEGNGAIELANLAAEEGRLKMLVDLRSQEVGPLQKEIEDLKRRRDTFVGRSAPKEVYNPDPAGGPGRRIDFYSDKGDTGSPEFSDLMDSIERREDRLGTLKDQISQLAKQHATAVEHKRLLQENYSQLLAERTRLNGEKTAAEAALAPKQARMAELGTAGESIATAYKDRLYSIIPEAFQTTINAQLAELSLAQDQVDQDRLERAVTVNGRTISNDLYNFARTATGERDHAVAMTAWKGLMAGGPGYVDTLMESRWGPDIFAELQRNPDNYLAVRSDLLKKMYRYRTEYKKPLIAGIRVGEKIPDEELKRFVDLAGEEILRAELSNPAVSRALSELTGSRQLDPSLPLEDQLRGKKGADIQAILSILFLVGGASLISLLGGRP